MTKFISRDHAKAILEALGEEFIIDIPAAHDGKGGYFIEFTTLANALVNPSDEWVDQIVGYANVKDKFEGGDSAVETDLFTGPSSAMALNG